MRKDIMERMGEWVDRMLIEGYSRDEIASAIECQKMAMDEEDEGEEEE